MVDNNSILTNYLGVAWIQSEDPYSCFCEAKNGHGWHEKSGKLIFTIRDVLGYRYEKL